GPAGRLNLQRSRFERDDRPIDPDCDCSTCDRYSRAALHSAVRMATPLGARLVSLHNVRALTRTAENVRSAVLGGTFTKLLMPAQSSSREESGASGDEVGRGRESRGPAASR